MTATFRVISIGTLSAHPFWSERGSVRAAHATTTLIVSGAARILVDPSLPASILLPKLAERSGLGAESVTHVYLTCFNPVHRRALASFEGAEWLIAEREREAIGQQLVAKFHEARSAGDADLLAAIGPEIAILERTKAAPDALAKGVDLFPLCGVTPGLTGLLLPGRTATVLIAGDAIPTLEHLESGQVLTPCFDVEMARASLGEAIEIADWIICGRDNVIPNPTRRPF
ncbi:MAG: hypothetical protein EXS10_07205 [Phycisphaerales bacterium]|nr:hypothetical protein [Phycisphaerales bacterium]